MRGHPGRWLQVIDGVHKGKSCIAYHADQHDEIRNAGKLCVTIDVEAEQGALFDGMRKTGIKKVLIDVKFLKNGRLCGLIIKPMDFKNLTPEEAQAIIEIMAMSRQELDRVPYEPVRWQCKIKLCKCYTHARDYGILPIFWHPRFGWPSQISHYFFCAKHWGRYKNQIKAGDFTRVPLKRLKNGAVPWGGDFTVNPKIIF